MEMTRRIDDLGRIAIPKNMRNELGIEEGDALFIRVKDDEIIIRKEKETKNENLL